MRTATLVKIRSSPGIASFLHAGLEQIKRFLYEASAGRQIVALVIDAQGPLQGY